MMTIENSWIRRAAFVVGNLAGLALLGGTLIAPLFAFFDERDRAIAEKRNLLARLNAIVAQEGIVRDRVQQSDKAATGDEFLVGANDGAVAADLQTRLKSIIGSAGARSQSVQSLPPRQVGPLRYVGVKVDVQGTLQSVHRTIHAIESAKPFVFITEAAIRPMATAGRPAVAQEPVIQAQLDVFGATRAEGSTR